MSFVDLDGLIDYANDEADDVASCLWKYKQLHHSCNSCGTREFCNLLKKKLDEWLEDERLESEGTAKK